MRILVPVDESSQSTRLIHFLLERDLLLGTDPEIELVNVQYSVPESLIRLFGLNEVKKYYQDTGVNVFEDLQKKTDFRSKLRTATERVMYGDVVKMLAEEAEASKADLIVMGARGLNPVQGLIFGSVSNGLLARTHVPMLVVRDESKLPEKKMRVGILVDGSAYGAAAANYVLEHLELFGEDPEFTVVHCAEPVPDPITPNPVNPMMPVLSREEIDEEQQTRFHEAVQPVLDPFEVAGLNVKAQLLVGEADLELPSFANGNLDLIVMGSHGRGNFTAAVLGSTAMHIAAETKVPMLVIRK